MAWATLDEAHRGWRESTAVDDVRLLELLELATATLRPEAYPSELDDLGDPIGPDATSRLREACIEWAKDAWAVSTSANGDVIGFDTYALRRRPLSDQVRLLLRNRRHAQVLG